MNLKTSAAALTAVASIALIGVAGASAHVSIHPNTVPAGAFATLDVRVPGERVGAHVREVDMLFPPGFTSVAIESVPGWSARTIYQHLAHAIQTDDGPIDTELSQVIWTWQGPLGEVDDNQFVEFPLSVAIPDGDAGRSLAFRTVQIYSDGTDAHWIGPPQADEPAPTINVTAAGGVIEDVAGAEAGPAPGQATTGAAGGGGTSAGLAVAALIVGALGVVLGGWALVALRRSRARG